MSPNEQTHPDALFSGRRQTKDTAKFVSMFAEGGYLSSGKTFYGKDIGETVDIMAAAFPDIPRDLLNVYLDGDVVIMELTINGTHDGDLRTPARVISPTHKAMKTPCCDVFHLKDGKVLSFHCYVIESVMMKQLGLALSSAPRTTQKVPLGRPS
jgi:predicted ester cyclase